MKTELKNQKKGILKRIEVCNWVIDRAKEYNKKFNFDISNKVFEKFIKKNEKLLTRGSQTSINVNKEDESLSKQVFC